jgi:hypothetical protein
VQRPLSAAPRTQSSHVPPVGSPRNVQPARRSAPVAGAVNAKRLTKVSTQGLGGGESRPERGTHHSVIEAVSAMRRERKSSKQRQAGKSRLIT